MRAILLLWIGIWLVGLTAASSSADKFTVGNFSNSRLESWEEKSFSSKTIYHLVNLQGTTVLKAESRGSASGLFRTIKVDLKRYPYLNWRWRIEQRLTTGTEKVKSGDDYAARIYVIIDGGFLPWRTKAVNYVWANKAEKHDIWPSAFAGRNSMMIALRNYKDPTATWFDEKRNVLRELGDIFGEDISVIDGIAIMTDTDNNKDETIAYYGDIYFSAN